MPGATAEDKWRYLQDGLSRFAGRRLELDAEVYESEAASNQRNQGIAHLLQELENPSTVWFSKIAQPMIERDRFLQDTFAKAVERTEKLLGNNPAQWRWGKLHTATFHHPTEKLGPAYAKAFNLGPVERWGDANTPLNTKHDDKFNQVHGASYRHVFDLADWDQGRATSTPGQSGQPGSPHYSDLISMWAEAKYFPLAYSRNKINEVSAHRLMLTPP